MARTPRRMRSCYTMADGTHIPGCMGCAVHGHHACTCQRGGDTQGQLDRLHRQVRLLGRRLRRMEKRAKGAKP